jgi:hypothetical protein
MDVATSAFERWAPWWGLLVVPTAFLTNQSAAYAIVAFACRSQHHALVHVFPALTLASALLGVALSGWCAVRGGPGVRAERRFLVMVSLAVAALFVLATLAQWYVAAALSPCLQ